MSTKNVIFIDSRVANYKTLAASFGADTEWFLLDASRDGVQQMQQDLAAYAKLDSVQILSHGSAGALYLGSTVLNSDNLQSYQSQLQAIGSSLSATGDILLYGCNVAQGDAGVGFVNTLAQIAGADVAASNNLTGASSAGADSALEVSKGTIEAIAIDFTHYTATLSTMTGTDNNDTLTGGGEADIIYALGGNDVVDGGTNHDWVDGGAGNDTLDGGFGNDTLAGGSGNDALNGALGTDTANYLANTNDLAGAATQGVYVNLAGGVAIDNWGAIDTLVSIENVNGSSLADSLNGDSGSNHLTGNAGNDTLSGGGGDDWLTGGVGKDLLDGGDGSDVGFFEDGTNAVVINLRTGIVSNDGFGNVEAILSVENLHGSNFNDVIQLGDTTGAYVFGRAGSDSLNGGNGNDNLIGGSGNDTLNGGAGLFDSASYVDDGYDALGVSTYGVVVNLATGTARDNWGGTDILTGIENVNGSAFADSITGNSGDNNLNGDAGNDTLSGGDGNDVLVGGAGK